MKSCEYCGRENVDDAVQCCECGTAEFKSSNASPPASIEVPDVADVGETEPFNKSTDLALADAQQFLAILENEGIPFRLVPLDSQMGEMDAFIASVGGSFGRATSVRIFTRLADDEKVERIWKEFCGIDK